MNDLRSCLYFGTVVHRRLRPRSHLLKYRVFNLCLDLDELPALTQRLRLFSHNRFNLFSFFDQDHGPGDGRDLRLWVEEQLQQAGITLDGGAIRIVCYPRMFGYVFNPLSVFFCHYRDGRLAAILYEVHNTFGERHSYLIPVADPTALVIHQHCEKQFYVSPFIAVAGAYQFRISPPDARLAIAISQTDDEGPLLHASFTGGRATLDDRRLLAALARYPLMTVKVIAGIHWEALRLWRKGIPLVRRPAPPANPVTIVAPAAS